MADQEEQTTGKPLTRAAVWTPEQQQRLLEMGLHGLRAAGKLGENGTWRLVQVPAGRLPGTPDGLERVRLLCAQDTRTEDGSAETRLTVCDPQGQVWQLCDCEEGPYWAPDRPGQHLPPARLDRLELEPAETFWRRLTPAAEADMVREARTMQLLSALLTGLLTLASLLDALVFADHLSWPLLALTLLLCAATLFAFSDQFPWSPGKVARQYQRLRVRMAATLPGAVEEARAETAWLALPPQLPGEILSLHRELVSGVRRLGNRDLSERLRSLTTDRAAYTQADPELDRLFTLELQDLRTELRQQETLQTQTRKDEATERLLAHSRHRNRF